MDADAPDNDVASQFDDIVSMILARSRGEVENDDIEHALSSIVAAGGGANGRDQETLVQQKDDSATKQFMELKRGQIIPDEGNYDDDDDDDDTKGMPLSTTTPLTITKKKKVSCKVKDSEKLKVSDPKRDQLIEQIPLGKMGERMLITFGDGPNPHPSVVDAALLGARSCLQRAILDARALRR